MKRWFENWELKLMALVLAFILWGYVGSKQVLQQRMNIKIELRNIPAGFMVDPHLQSRIPVIFSGRKRDILKLNPSQLNAVIDLSRMSRTRQSMKIIPKILQMPQGISAEIPDIDIHLLLMPTPTTSATIARKMK
jgi:YbbR domain-containing protein